MTGNADLCETTHLRIRSVQANLETDLSLLRALLVEYAEGLGIDLEFQHFAEELANLPGAYALPAGCLLLAEWRGQMAGCVALRPLEEDICELKRLYVRPSFRANGIGRALSRAAIDRAQDIGYARMRLDTLPWMDAAVALYRSLGFVEIEPYCHNPVPGARFFELTFTTRPSPSP
jgi:ribosomal protein S18 acetylase RimI-like enzyme